MESYIEHIKNGIVMVTRVSMPGTIMENYMDLMLHGIVITGKFFNAFLI